MSEKTREHISSLMDGEVSAETGRFLLRRLGSDADLSATWARYHLVRDCLRHDDGTLYGSDLCRRVNRALQDEPVARGGRWPAQRWLRPVAGGAIAATVALMAVLVVDPGNRAAPDATTAGVARAEPAASFISPDGLNGVPVSRAASIGSPPPAANARMNQYLLRHYQATGGNNGRGFFTIVPVMVQRGAQATDDAGSSQGEAEPRRPDDQ
ncbi:MAG: RseA family anti-sigma factor [Xanthomonadales bacterium]